MATKLFSRLFQLSALSLIVGFSVGNYVITTPRKWSMGETVQICVFSINSSSTNNSVEVILESHTDSSQIIPRRIINIPPDQTEHCDKLTIPVVPLTNGQLKLTGEVGGQRFNHRKKIKFAGRITKTFVETDKFLYKPGQKVQFRILTLSGPFLKISTNQYPLVWVETPHGSRIAQWVNLDNSAGLIHQVFKLSEEPEEGTYKIHVDSPDEGESITQIFKVEEYVLPRFEVTVTPPKLLLGDDEEFSFNVCAKYTYGQDVKGNVTLKVDNSGWGSSKVVHVIRDRISGCKDFQVTAEDVSMNGDNYYAQNLEARASVVEDGTEEVLEGSTSIKVERTALKFKVVGDENFVKPGLPYTGKVKVEFPDGSAAPGEVLEVCAAGNCKNITTDSAGILTFIAPDYADLHIHVQSLRFKSPSSSSSHYSWRRIMHSAEFTYHVKRYYSPSNSSLVIHAPTSTLPCTNGAPYTHLLPLLYAATNQSAANITVQVVSRGQIQFSRTDEHQLTSTPLLLDGTLLSPLLPIPQHTIQGRLSLALTLPPTASPTAKVVVWYSRTNGEVVSDARHLKVETCYTNPVILNWSTLRAHPGDQVDINLSSEPQSICSVGVVDKSVELLSSASDSLSVSGVFQIVEQAMVESWENPQVDDIEYCHTKMLGIQQPEPVGRARRLYLRPRFSSDYVDTLKMFDNSGLFIFSDMTVETRPCTERARSTGEVRRRLRLGKQRKMGSLRYSIALQPHLNTQVLLPNQSPTKAPINQKLRSYFPEMWLWKLINISESGVNSESVSLPHTITEWVGKAVCVHPDKGLGVSQRAPITTFTPFFIDLTLPPAVKRGETLNVKISIFNYLDADLPVKLVLEPSSDYEILEETVEIIDARGVAMEGMVGAVEGTRTRLGPGQRSSCVPSQDKTVHSVRVRPGVVGDVNITVWAEVDPLYPDVCGPEYVVSKRDHLVKPIRVDVEGFPKEKTWTKYICSKDLQENLPYLEQWNIAAPSDIVPDSARGWITAVSDLLGPTLENLGSLVKMPYGCGEQNMLNFAPNVFILQYLEASRQTTPEIAEKAIEYMKQGYQRELRYRHSDGSYSAFGSSDPMGSTWLTAFVLKSFAQARQFIQIDSEDINMSREWLRSGQMENGCFESVGKVFHKGMKGGIDSEGSPVPLSSYLLISLLESGETSTSRTVSEAAFCLVADKTKDPYTLALKSYALALADAPEAQLVLQQLITLATETSSSMFWNLPAGSGKSEGVAVETAGYAILAMTTIAPDLYDVQATKIVKWISSQRNGQGGFISTQDTVVALQALASFEAHQQKGNVTDLMVIVESETLNHNFHIDEKNKLLQQSVPLPSGPINVFLDLLGEGCALVQAVLRYNIPEDLPSESFALTIATQTAHDKLCITKIIKACASYQLPDKKSNMAVIEVNLVSGYIPKKADLKRIVGYGTGLIKRYEVDGSQVIFYVDEFSPRETCVKFDIIREVEVENVKPGTVRVYDYYQPEYFTTKSYTLPPNTDCLTGPDPELVIEGIIVDTEEAGVDTAALEDFIDVLNEMP